MRLGEVGQGDTQRVQISEPDLFHETNKSAGSGLILITCYSGIKWSTSDREGNRDEDNGYHRYDDAGRSRSLLGFGSDKDVEVRR